MSTLKQMMGISAALILDFFAIISNSLCFYLATASTGEGYERVMAEQIFLYSLFIILSYKYVYWRSK